MNLAYLVDSIDVFPCAKVVILGEPVSQTQNPMSAAIRAAKAETQAHLSCRPK
jgi:hypothetical protein